MSSMAFNAIERGHSNILFVQGDIIPMVNIESHSMARDHFLEGKEHVEEKGKISYLWKVIYNQKFTGQRWSPINDQPNREESRTKDGPQDLSKNGIIFNQNILSNIGDRKPFNQDKYGKRGESLHVPRSTQFILPSLFPFCFSFILLYLPLVDDREMLQKPNNGRTYDHIWMNESFFLAFNFWVVWDHSSPLRARQRLPSTSQLLLHLNRSHHFVLTQSFKTCKSIAKPHFKMLPKIIKATYNPSTNAHLSPQNTFSHHPTLDLWDSTPRSTTTNPCPAPKYERIIVFWPWHDINIRSKCKRLQHTSNPPPSTIMISWTKHSFKVHRTGWNRAI